MGSREQEQYEEWQAGESERDAEKLASCIGCSWTDMSEDEYSPPLMSRPLFQKLACVVVKAREMDDIIQRLRKGIPGDNYAEWKLRQETADALASSLQAALALLKSTRS